jgi:hypothetical protein
MSIQKLREQPLCYDKDGMVQISSHKQIHYVYRKLHLHCYEFIMVKNIGLLLERLTAYKLYRICESQGITEAKS